MLLRQQTTKGDMDNMKGICNRCGKVSRMKHRKKRLRNRIDKHFYRCDHCGHEYLIGYMNDNTRTKAKWIRKLNKLKYRTEEQEQRIKTLNNEIKNEMEQLAGELEGRGLI